MLSLLFVLCQEKGEKLRLENKHRNSWSPCSILPGDHHESVIQAAGKEDTPVVQSLVREDL